MDEPNQTDPFKDIKQFKAYVGMDNLHERSTWCMRTVDVDAAHAALLAQHREEVHDSCPCRHTTPCHPACTCVVGISSRGCHRCCAYGSDEQQRKMAEHLAKQSADLLLARDEIAGLKREPTSLCNAPDSNYSTHLICDRQKGHVGEHTWEWKPRIEDLIRRVQQAEAALDRRADGLVMRPRSEEVARAERAEAALQRMTEALKAIQALDFRKTGSGRDDFYSGPAVFVRAWALANEALASVLPSTPSGEQK